MKTPSDADTPPLTAEDVRNVQEVLDSQIALGHLMTLVPTDVLARLLDATRAAQPATASIDVAWAEAEKALPGTDWSLLLWRVNSGDVLGYGIEAHYMEERHDKASGDWDYDNRTEFVHGTTPAAALHALAARLSSAKDPA